MHMRLLDIGRSLRPRWSVIGMVLALGTLLWLASLGGSWALHPTSAQGASGCLVGQIALGGAQTIPGTIPTVCQPYTVYVQPCLPEFPGEYVTAQADEYGRFVACGLPEGTYDVLVYGRNTPANKETVTITAGTIPGTIPGDSIPGTIPLVDFGTLLPGDATNDNTIDILDFSALSSAYDTSVGDARYDAQANFNCDEQVDEVDLGLLEANYRHTGATCDGGTIPGAGAAFIPKPSLYLLPAEVTVEAGETFELQVMASCGYHGDAAAAALSFDTDNLEVQSLTPDTGSFSTLLPGNGYDNATGTLVYDAGSLACHAGGSCPRGDVRIATVTLRAKAGGTSTVGVSGTVAWEGLATFAGEGTGTTVNIITGGYQTFLPLILR